MTALLDLVDEPGGTTLFGLQDSAGVKNPYGVGFAVRDSTLDLGAFDTEFVAISPATDGGSIVSSRNPLLQVRLRLRAASGDLSDILDALGFLGVLLDRGGSYLAWSPDGLVETRYIPLEPSPSVQAFLGQVSVLDLAGRDDVVFPEIPVFLNRQPWAEGEELSPATNLVSNPTLTHDFGGTANRPDDWTWTSTTGLSAETIDLVEDGIRRGVYRFTMADGAAKSLQFTTPDSSYASGDIGVFSFYARVVAVAGTPRMQATLQFQTNAAGNVGGLHSGGLVTLTTAWQRISVVSTAAGATTGQALVSIQIDNADATSVVVEICNAQAEKTAVSPFRVPSAAVAYNPASTTLPRRIAVWAEGDAPTKARLRATADALTMGRYRVYSVAEKAVEILKATLHKSLRSGTLGADTASTADADGLDGNVAAVTYSEPDPAFGTDTTVTGSGASPTAQTVTHPASLAVGDCLVVIFAYQKTNGNNVIIGPPEGWRSLGQQAATGSQSGNLFPFVKIATAADVAAGSSVFSFLITPGAGTAEWGVWCGRFPNVDQEDPVDAFAFAAQTGADSTPTAPSITTSADDAEIITAYFVANGSSPASFTAPAGSTPTYTEQADFQLPTTSKALAVYTGVLATAGATGTKDATETGGGDTYVMLNMSLNKAKAALAPRSTVTFLGTGTGALPSGEYDLWLRYRPTAACLDRIRVEYALRASPSEFVALPDFILETRGATSFSEYEEHLMGRISVPEDQPLDTMTVRVSSGRVASSSASLRLDAVILAPVFERAALLSSDVVLANGEHFLTYPELGAVYHLASDSDQSDRATVDGPTPIELAPGYNVLVAWPAVMPLAGYLDPATEVTSAPTLSVTHAPRYRT